jgi:hypothetical protein
MRHLKLFEQFEEDEWWDEGSKFDDYRSDKLMLFGNNDTNTLFVGSIDTDGNKILFFKNLVTEPHLLSDRYFRIVPLDNVKKGGIIAAYDKNDPLGFNGGWRYYALDTLPKEIKDRLI